MNIVKSVDQEKQLTVFTVVGNFTFEMAIETLRSFYENDPTKNVLCDFRNANFEFLTAQHIEKIIYYSKLHGKARAGGKTAWVISGDLEFGIARMTKTLAELGDIPFDSMMFRSMEEATQWLEEDG